MPTISQSAIFTTLVICSLTAAIFAQSNDRITAKKENNYMSVTSISEAGKNVIDTKPVSCSICNSISKEGLTEQEVRRMGAAGQDCINNPKNYVKSCDQWRADHSEHPLNKSIRYTGCYKTVFTYDYDIDGNKKTEERVVRSCGFLGTPGCFSAPGHGTTQKICFCTGPECNGSSSLIPGFISFISLIISFMLLRL